MIQTKPFKQSESSYFNLVLRVQFRRRWWILVLAVLVGIANLFLVSGNPVKWVWVVFGFGYPLIWYLYLKYWVHKQMKQTVFGERTLSFDRKVMIFEMLNGMKDEIPFDTLVDIKEQPEYWMLYIAKGQFIYVPKDAFRSEEDRSEFFGLIQPYFKI